MWAPRAKSNWYVTQPPGKTSDRVPEYRGATDSTVKYVLAPSARGVVGVAPPTLHERASSTTTGCSVSRSDTSSNRVRPERGAKSRADHPAELDDARHVRAARDGLGNDRKLPRFVTRGNAYGSARRDQPRATEIREREGHGNCSERDHSCGQGHSAKTPELDRDGRTLRREPAELVEEIAAVRSQSRRSCVGMVTERLAAKASAMSSGANCKSARS